MNRFRYLLAVSLWLAALVLPVARAAETAAPSSSNVIVPKLEISEVITVNVVGQDDLAISATISPRGTVNLKYVGEVPVAGLTVPEAEAAIAKAYIDGRFLRRPEVRVSVDQRNEKVATVRGEVVSPGRYPLPADSTINLADLIIRAGGFTDLARGSRVILTRVLPDGTTQVREYDVEGMINGKIPRSEAPIIQADDLIEVKMRLF